MPKFPTYERSVGLGGGATASYASDGAFTAPGRALAGLGGTIANLGETFDAEAEKIRNTQDEAWFSKARAQTATDMIAAEQEAQKAATGEAGTYIADVTGRFNTYRNERLAEAPTPRAQQLYNQWADSYGVDLTQRSTRFQAESELTKRTSDFAEAMNAHSQAIYADPSQYDTVYKRAMDDLEGARKWMKPEQETKARETVDRNLKLSRAKSLALFAPDDFLAEVGRNVRVKGGPQQWREAIASIESAGSGGYAAVGPRHPKMGRALGKYQIMESNIGPWSEKHLGRRVTAEEFMRDPKIQDAIFDGEFGSYVKRFGDPGKAAQAWIGGTGGVGKVGRKDVLGTSIGEYEAKFNSALAKLGGGETDVRVGGDFSQDPRYAGLSIDEIAALQNDAQRTVSTQQSTQYAALKDQIELGIATGQITGENQILGSGLNGGDQATLLGKLRTAQEEGRNLTEAWTAFKDGSLSLDSYDSKARTLVDRMERSLMQDSGGTGGAAEQPTGGLGRSVRSIWADEMVRRTGIVPIGTVSEINRGLESGKLQEVAAAASRAARIQQIDPSALGKRDNGSKAADAATAFSHYVDNVGMTEDQAAQRIIDQRDPEKVAARKSLMDSEPAKKFLKDKASEATVRDIFDPGVFGFDPRLGENPRQAAAMVGEYRSILEESLFDANGDVDLAKTYADQRFALRYAPSSFTLAGENIITRLPPERTYPPGQDGSHDYVRQQAIETLKAEGIETEKVFLQSDENTDADWRAKKPARYRLFYEKDGSVEMFNFPFYAVPPEGAGLSENKAKWEENKAQLEAGRDRDKSLDNFLDGNPLTGGN